MVELVGFFDPAEEPLSAFASGHDLIVERKDDKRVAIIRTSDRILFKQCRRRWGWASHLRHNLGPKSDASALWMGTGFHFALEDFHGYNRFGHPKVAFNAFVDAYKKFRKDRLPDDYEELIELTEGMFDWYIVWLQIRKNTLLKTLWVDGVPQVEVNFRFQIPWEPGRFGYDEVFYSGTIDRVCVDDNGLLWALDYKTAKEIKIMHLATDPQISTYMWALPHLYNKPIGGFKYMQFKKQVPAPPPTLVRGGVSVNQQMTTNHYFYQEALIREYGSVQASPEKNQIFLQNLAFQEDENKDAFIQIDSVNRNERHGQSEGTKILMEIEDMLNPDLPLYPNPTIWCAHHLTTCPFLSPCTSLDDGSDWLHELTMTTEERPSSYDAWRKHLVWPGQTDPAEDKRLHLDTDWLNPTSDPEA